MQKAVLSGAVVGGIVLIGVLAATAIAQLETLGLTLRIVWMV
jgi:hypothetical protein